VAQEEQEVFDPNSFVLYDIPGSEIKRAVRRDSTGALLETGFLDGDVRVGAWTTYPSDTGMPWKQITFIDGKYNGLYLEYTTRGQVNLIANYKNNLLHGFWGKYNFSRPVILANYNEGQLDGLYKKYHPNKNNVLQEVIEYDNGEIDGKYRYYNEEGKMVMEYDYKNGKKVGGGMVSE